MRAGQPYIYEHTSTVCKSCEHQTKTAWRTTPEAKAAERRFRLTNEKHRNYRNTEAGRATLERYRASADNLLRQSRADYKARGGIGPITLTVEELGELLATYGLLCAYCRVPLRREAEVGDPQKLTLDHIEPIDRGGGHTRANVVPACFRCNARKSTVALRPLPPPSKSSGV